MKLDYEANLDENQIQAVLAPIEGSTLVLAGPGGGKTRVLVYRAAHLLEEGVQPERLVLCTFTKKAAEEMAERIARLAPPEVVARMHVRTIHSLCYWLLRQEGLTYDVITPWQQKRLMQNILGYKGLDWDVGWKWPLRLIGSAKSKAIHYPESLDFFEEYLELAGCEDWLVDEWSEKLTRAYEMYEKGKFFGDSTIMLPGHKFDFKDMLLLTYDLLTGMMHPDIELRGTGERYKALFEHIMVDEVQDTGRQSMDILEMLASPQNNLFAVGDEDQELFRWAGASPDYNIRGFEQRLSPTVVKLGVNYRSTKRIVDLSRKLIDYNYEPGDPFQKDLVPSPFAVDGQDATVSVFTDSDEESIWVVETICGMLEAGFQPQDFFIVYRINALSEPFERRLIINDIPYMIEGAVGFWDRKIVKDILAFIRVAVDPCDNESVLRIGNMASKNHRTHFHGLGKAFYRDAAKIDPDCLYVGMKTMYDMWIDDGDRGHYFKATGIKDFIWIVENLQRMLRTGAAPLGLVHWIRENVYDSYLVRSEGISDPQSEEAGSLGSFEDLESLYDAVAEYSTVDKLFEAVEVMQGKAASEELRDKCVVLTSIHKVKGRERPVVFIVGASEGIIPHIRALGWKGPNEMPVISMSGLPDERCAMYVAVTRAKSDLYISSVLVHRGHETQPSRFITEMGLGDQMEEQCGRDSDLDGRLEEDSGRDSVYYE